MPDDARVTGLQGSIDPALRSEIAAMRAIDEHAHPLPLGVEQDGDADTPVNPYDMSLPIRLRPDNPEYVDAWAALWGFEHRETTVARLGDLVAVKRAKRLSLGQDYNVWVLDQLKFETMITMAYGPGPTEPAPRFRFCGRCDWLLWPFPCDPMLDFGNLQTMLDVMGRAYKGLGRDAPPATLDAFVSDIVSATLERYHAQRAVGLKFQTPYYRAIDFANVSKADAVDLYARGAAAGSLPLKEHKALQDFIFGEIARQAGEYGFVLQMHTGLGVKPWFDIAGSNPILMEPIMRSTPKTRYLLLHGGWPFDRETVALLAHENVYTDFSCANIFKYARGLADQIRPAIEWHPEKIMFGTDAYSDRSLAMLAGVAPRANPLHGWEEKAWLMDRAGRDALGLALTGMRDDGEVSNERASALARMVMSDNSIRLYGL